MQKRTPQPGDVKLSVSVNPAVWRMLRDLATEQRRSLNDLLNEWIEEKLGLASKTPPLDQGAKSGSGSYRIDSHSASRCADRGSEE